MRYKGANRAFKLLLNGAHRGSLTQGLHHQFFSRPSDPNQEGGSLTEETAASPARAQAHMSAVSAQTMYVPQTNPSE